MKLVLDQGLPRSACAICGSATRKALRFDRTRTHRNSSTSKGNSRGRLRSKRGVMTRLLPLEASRAKSPKQRPTWAGTEAPRAKPSLPVCLAEFTSPSAQGNCIMFKRSIIVSASFVIVSGLTGCSASVSADANEAPIGVEREKANRAAQTTTLERSPS